MSHSHIPTGATLLDDMFVNTLAVTYKGKVMYVTHMFCHASDNVKASDETDSTLGGVLLETAAKKLGRKYRYHALTRCTH